MTNRVLSFLEHVGQDFKNGLVKIQPFIDKGVALAEEAEPFVAAIDPAIGPLFTTVVAEVASIEQKFTQLGKATGTGPQKLAEATSILEPVIAQAFGAAGKAADTATVQKYISAVVDFLNAIPASSPAATPAAPVPATS